MTRRILIHVAAVALMAACATSGTSRELVEARATFARANASGAPAEAPASMAEAARLLQAAERANASDARSMRERQLAYLATRQAQIAIAEANARVAKKDAELARAALARRANEALTAAEASKAEATSEGERRAEIERELAETRTKLAEKGQALDQQTQQLRDRETALQAELAALRGERERVVHERDAALAQVKEFAKIQEEKRGLVITMPAEVLFRVDEATLLPPARAKLEEVAAALQKLGPGQTFMIEGHTDSRGTAEYNVRLSKARANAVREFLISRGVEPGKIIASGRGEAEPVAENTNPEGRANNRRVEIIVTPPAVSVK